MTTDELNTILQSCKNIRNRIKHSVIPLGVTQYDLFNIERIVKHELKLRSKECQQNPKSTSPDRGIIPQK